MATFEGIQAKMAQNAQDIGKRYAEAPGIINKYSPESDSIVSALRQQHSDKVKQLFKYDTELAQTKFQPQAAPGPTATGQPAQAAPEMIIDPTIGLKAANTQTMATAGEVGDILKQIGTRKDYLSESLNKALQLFEIGIKAKQMENDALQNEFNNLLKLEDLAISRKNAAGTSSASSDLQTLLENIGRVKETKEKITPVATGITKANPINLLKFSTRNPSTGLLEPNASAGPNYRALISELNKYPKADFDFQQNSDGTYSWAVRKPVQQFVSPEEAKIYEDVPGLINQIAATTIASNSKIDRGDVEAIVNKLMPTSSNVLPVNKRTANFQAKVNEAQAIVNDMRKQYLPEETVQAAIKEMYEREPGLIGYIK